MVCVLLILQVSVLVVGLSLPPSSPPRNPHTVLFLFLFSQPFILFSFFSQVTGWEGELGEALDLQEQVGMDSLQAVEFRRIICTQVSRAKPSRELFP